MQYEFLCIMQKINHGYASTSIDATQSEQKSRFVIETPRVGSPLNQQCTESIMIT